jgi:stage II sporulation protein D
MSSDIFVSIGLLWDETIVRGELVGDHLVEVCTLESRQPEVFAASGHFTIHTQAAVRHPVRGIRLAESLSHAHAERVIEYVQAKRGDLSVGIVQAGRQWRVGTSMWDGRVWWPVVKLDEGDSAVAALNDLRDIPGIDPIALTVVKLNDAVPTKSFSLELAKLSCRCGQMKIKPMSEKDTFILHEVPIGRGFHWERKESLEYRGELVAFHPGGGGVTIANRLPLETYLQSTVSSEMRSDLPPAFSQAQAIAARSTVLATAGRHHRADGFDLCNDDHCQCYQGIVRENEAVMAPVRQTAGQILVFSPPTSVGGQKGVRIVDARYAKSCGGVTERYEIVWGAEGPDYFDICACGDFPVPDLSIEQNAREFLLHPPVSYCDGQSYPYPEPWDKDPLFRWEKSYVRAGLGEIVQQKTGVRTGPIKDLRVLKRGKSGRIIILDIIGTEGGLRAYGELNIRRALSLSHLPSSYFVVENKGDDIILRGGGWGHGVGLCQLGAAAMAKAGKSVEEILAHYYPRSELQTIITNS